ncbi:MAG: T9SS type A sorting domain-containing protein [Prolixibacteraceae bacterium]|jgi:hypothetical protein|nr:T9SS type A sorting domain-containing protein [Prolixibacteraceae bacterium]
MKRTNILTIVFLIQILLFAVVSTAQNNLRVQYLFNTNQTDNQIIVDETGNGYNGMLMNGAEVQRFGSLNVLQLEGDSEYFDFGSSFGEVVAGLEDFTISTYLFVDEEASLSSHGNFVWSFSNSVDMGSEQNGGLFFSARDSRYTIYRTHWTNEESVTLNQNFEKGSWKHITYTQNGQTGILYYDGVEVQRGNITIKPSELGATAFNFIGRSPYSGDVYLSGAMLYDFRVYNKSLNASELSQLLENRQELDNALAKRYLYEAANIVMTSFADVVLSDLELPVSVDDISISWQSSNPNVISTNGKVIRPDTGSEAIDVELTATFQKDGQSISETITVTVMPSLSDEESVQTDAGDITLEGRLENLRDDIDLPSKGNEGSIITWASSEPDYLTNSGEVVQLSPTGEGKKHVILTATISKGDEKLVLTFDVYIAEDEGYDAYLFTYFTGNGAGEEAIRFALSKDGFNYKAVNNNRPIISSSAISSTGGVRDPHILRGEDGYFYMVVTDLQVAVNGWNNNQAMVFLKSSDLVNWSHSIVNIADMFPEMESVTRVWAPQTFYDERVGKYMVYWSMLFDKDRGTAEYYDKIYYAYANDDFTSLETEPIQLYYSPTKQACIDGDIIHFDGKYHLFHKTEGSGNGIKKAVSNTVSGGYELYDKYLHQTNEAVEGSSVFKLINTDTYILMYDMYMTGKYQFTESTDLLNFSVIDEEISMDFWPRHGTVMPITAEEANRISQKWDGVDFIEVDDTGIDEKGVVSTFKVYPNPANNKLIIQSDSQIDNVKLYALSGEVVACFENINQLSFQFDVSEYQSGAYILMLNDVKAESVLISR